MDSRLLQALRTEWLSLANAPGKGKSRSKSLLIHGDPAGTLANAPIATYIDIVWGSVHDKQGMPTLPTIREWVTNTPQAPRTWGE